jgi:hypothetical protein
MHRQIINAGPELVVHHKNHNTLDNRRANLILATPQIHKWFHAHDAILHINQLKTGGTPQTQNQTV